ncbi:MAG: DUF456 domain-containing protein [Phycisphaerae bacterium]|nr:DUF456 domain-containing protein [Phycisphaerae bacterium]
MIYVYAILLCLINAVWLATVVFYFPGNWMIVLSTAALAWWQRDAQMISFWTIGVMAFLALIGEFIEFLAGLGGAKQAGAGWLASIAAIGGAIVGAIFGTFLLPIPLLGTLLGACIGAGLATWSFERITGKEQRLSMRSGVGAGLGVFIGTSSKVAIGVVLYLIAAVAAFL